MKKGLYIILLLTIFSITCNAQIRLKIQELAKTENSINILMSVTNTSEKDSILFFIPRDSSFFMALIHTAFHEKNTGKKHMYCPSNELLDIDRIHVDRKNSVLLSPGYSYVFMHKIRLNRICPFLEKAKYLLKVYFTYEVGNLESDLKYKIFKGSTESNTIEIINNTNTTPNSQDK